MVRRLNALVAFALSGVASAFNFDDSAKDMLLELSTCAGVELDLESCLVSTFLPLYSEQLNAFNVAPQVCDPPEVNEDDIRTLMNQASDVCKYSGIEVDQSEVDTSIGAIMGILSSDVCWRSFCDSLLEEVNEFIEDNIDGATMQIKQLVVDSIASCTGADLSPESCVVSTSLDMILFMSGTEGEGEQARRVLQGGNPADSICMLPSTIDDAMVLQIVNDAEAICIASGQDVTDDSAEEVMNAISTLFSDESCWMPLCIEAEGKVWQIVEKVLDTVNETVNSYDLKSMTLAYVFDCASVEINMDSCAQTALVDAMMSYEDDEFGNKAAAYLEDTYYYPYQCPIPRFDSDKFVDLLKVATEKCEGQGMIAMDDEMIEVDTLISVLLNADKCWEATCSEDSFLAIASTTLQNCLSIDFPLSLTNPLMVQKAPGNYTNDAKLACMINYAMSDSINAAGSEKCLPPFYEEIKTMCPAFVGPAALDYCDENSDSSEQFKSGTRALTQDEYSMSYSYDYDPMSMSYYHESMSYQYDLSFSYKLTDDDDYDLSFSYNLTDDDDYYKDDDDEDHEHDVLPNFPSPGPNQDDTSMDLIEQLCVILEEMSTEKGQMCMNPLCHLKDDLQNLGRAESVKPSISPSIQPSVQPSMGPSMGPSITNIQPTATQKETGSVEIKFEAAITLKNIAITDVPTDLSELNAMVDVLKQVLLQFLPANSALKIISVGGVAINMRKLQEGLEVKFEVTMTSDCDTPDCNEADEVADTMYNDVKETFQAALTSGELVTAIQEEAEAEGITVLESVSVDADSFEAQEMVVKVETVDDNTDDGNDDIGASSAIKVRAAVVAMSGIVMLTLL